MAQEITPSSVVQRKEARAASVLGVSYHLRTPMETNGSSDISSNMFSGSEERERKAETCATARGCEPKGQELHCSADMCVQLFSSVSTKSALQEWQDQTQANAGASAETVPPGSTFPSGQRPQFICLESRRMRQSYSVWL